MLSCMSREGVDHPESSRSDSPRWVYDQTADPDAKPYVPPYVDSTAVVDSYLECCKLLGASAHPSILIFLRIRLAALQPVPPLLAHDARVPFCDRDLQAFCEFVLHRGGGAVFEHWETLDLHNCFISPAGCQILALVLRQPACRVRVVNVKDQKIGREGTAALVRTLRARRDITHVQLPLAFVEDDGAREILGLLSAPDELGELREIVCPAVSSRQPPRR